jgi:hypothetical protein
VLFRSNCFTPQDIAQMPIEKEAGWAPKSTWTFWKKEKPLVPAGLRTLAQARC